MAIGFANTFAEMWHRWFPSWHHGDLSLYDRITGGASYYTHGPLVPFISLLIAVLLIRHTRIRVRPRPVLGGVVLVASILLHLTACLARVNFASGFAFIGILVGMVLMVWGAEALRRLWFPIAILFFMVPLPQVMIANMNFRLRMFATEVGVTLAGAIGITAERAGNQILLLNDKMLVVGNVCNGLRTLISLLAFGSLYTYICRLQGGWRLLLFAASFVVAVIANSLRILSLIFVAEVWDVQTATGRYHDSSGVAVFILAFLMMFGAEKLILWARRALGRPAKVVALFHDVRRTDEDAEQTPALFGALHGARGWVAVGLMVVSAAGTWWLSRSIAPAWNLRVASAALPVELCVADKVLHSYDVPLDQETMDVLETEDCLNRQYVAADVPPTTICIIFSRDNRKGTHPPDVCLEGAGGSIVDKRDVDVEAVAGEGGVSCRELIVQTGKQKLYFLYTYKCGPKYTRSFWSQQFAIFANGILGRDSSGALIRVSTVVGGSLDEARRRSVGLLRAAMPHLDQKLK
jgi:EpsI family protein